MKNLKYYLEDAMKHGYAIGAFNFFNMEGLKAICQAAEEEKSPVIISVSEGALKYMGPEIVQHLAKGARRAYNAPIFLHLDHGKSFEVCKLAIALDFDSVMIDGSSLSLKENIRLTKKVVDYAHRRGVLVEGEIGVLAGIEDEVSATKQQFTDPEEAKIFANKTKVDMLAVAIGTSHGAYKFTGEPNLRLDILQEIQIELPKLPIVLHGASTVPEKYIAIANKFGAEIKGARGVSEALINKACLNFHIAKINTDTDLRISNTAGIREFLTLNKNEIDPRKYLSFGQSYMVDVIKHKMRNVLNSSNKYVSKG